MGGPGGGGARGGDKGGGVGGGGIPPRLEMGLGAGEYTLAPPPAKKKFIYINKYIYIIIYNM